MSVATELNVLMASCVIVMTEVVVLSATAMNLVMDTSVLMEQHAM